MTEPVDPFADMLDAYKAAVLKKDVDAFAALYDNDVHVFDMWGAWSLRGLAAWRHMAIEWFSSLGSERVVVSVSAAQSTVIGELAVGHAILTYTALSAEGEELRSLNNRITVALKRSDGLWRVIHEHTSAPIDHQSLKAVLRYADDK